MPKWLLAIFLTLAGLVGLLMTLCGMTVSLSGGFDWPPLLFGLFLGVIPGGLILWGVAKAWARGQANQASGSDGAKSDETKNP